MPFDLQAQYVDVAAGASHKWLCSPEGCGILYLSDSARERIEPTLVGWISVEEPWDFEDYGAGLQTERSGLGIRHRDALRFFTGLSKA